MNEWIVYSLIIAVFARWAGPAGALGTAMIVGIIAAVGLL